MTRGAPPIRTRKDVLEAIDKHVARKHLAPGIDRRLFIFNRGLPPNQQPPINREHKLYEVAYNTMKSWREKYDRNES